MRQTLSRGMVAAAAATGILSLCGNPVYADSGASGSAADSPGIASGNTLQVPVHIPINVCGNSVDVVGVLNPAFGNSCANRSDSPGSSTVPFAPAAGDDTPVTPHTPIENPCFCGHDRHDSPVEHGDFDRSS
ncbi:MAG: chaplin, partial [Streptomyces sp.]|nr:chaplin [Streptomyces sp.]